jgi:hypothetical protein
MSWLQQMLAQGRRLLARHRIHDLWIATATVYGGVHECRGEWRGDRIAIAIAIAVVTAIAIAEDDMGGP